MAEINIQKKSKPIWPWVVLLLLALVVAAFLYLNYIPDDPAEQDANAANAYQPAVQLLRQSALEAYPNPVA